MRTSKPATHLTTFRRAAILLAAAAATLAPQATQASADTGYGTWRSADGKHAVGWQAQYTMTPKVSSTQQIRQIAVRLNMTYMRTLRPEVLLVSVEAFGVVRRADGSMFRLPGKNTRGGPRALYTLAATSTTSGWLQLAPDTSGKAPVFARVIIPAAPKDPRTGAYVSWENGGSIRYRICFTESTLRRTCTPFAAADN
jgi:hypothetical protein